MGDRFDGFDWVREIQFRGTLGFTDGDDIRQWEGIVTVDAATFTPIQIQAQPRAQDERIKEMYDRLGAVVQSDRIQAGARGRWATARRCSSACARTS